METKLIYFTDEEIEIIDDIAKYYVENRTKELKNIAMGKIGDIVYSIGMMIEMRRYILNNKDISPNYYIEIKDVINEIMGEDNFGSALWNAQETIDTKVYNSDIIFEFIESVSLVNKCLTIAKKLSEVV